MRERKRGEREREKRRGRERKRGERERKGGREIDHIRDWSNPACCCVHVTYIAWTQQQNIAYMYILLPLLCLSLSLSLSLSLIHVSERQPRRRLCRPTALFSLSSCHPFGWRGFRLDIVGTIVTAGIASEGMNRFCFQLKISSSWELTSREAASAPLISYLPSSSSSFAITRFFFSPPPAFTNYVFTSVWNLKSNLHIHFLVTSNIMAPRNVYDITYLVIFQHTVNLSVTFILFY